MIEIFPDPDAQGEAAAAATLTALATGLAARGHATLVGTGGRSPGPTYDRLAIAALDWGRVTVTLSDDRFVPATDPDSNEGLIRRRLLVGPAAAASFQPLRYAVPTPQASAEVAEPHLNALAPWDMLLLGMGEDGHVASLIPGDPHLGAHLDPDGPRFVVPVPAGIGTPPLARISLTLPALRAARATLILVAGAAKREIVERGSGLPVHAVLKQAKAPVCVLWTP